MFCLVGIVCQCPVANPNEQIELPQPTEKVEPTKPVHLREALGGMVSALSNIENTFLGRLENEITIDPLAIYRDV